MKRFLAGLLVGVLLVVGADFTRRAVQARRKPHPTARVVNEPTKAREVRQLKPGRDPDERFIPMHVERH